MIAVSNNFKKAMTQPIKELDAYIIGDTTIKSEDNLISFKISCDTGMCKSAMRKLEAKYLGEHNLLGQWVHVGYGVKLPAGTFEYLDYGSFLVTEITTVKDTGVTTIVGYDKMVSSMKNYTKLDVEYPVKLIDYTRLLCEACGLELGNDIFGDNLFNYKSIDDLISNDRSTISVINNGFKVTSNQTITYAYARIKLDKPEKLLGKTIRFNCDISVSGTNDSSVVLYWGNDNALITSIQNLTNNNTVTIPNDFPTGTNSILLLLYSNFTSPTGVVGDYVEYTNIQLTEIDRPSIYRPYNQMNDYLVTRELWENINGITYRDILVQIAQATGTTCIISNDDKVYFKSINNTGDQLTYDNMKKLKLEPKYGEINSVILARTPQEDNIYMRDEDSIQANGLTEFKIENNEIVDKDRDNAMTPIYEALRGISYYPFETTTEGLGWYEIADSFDIKNDSGDIFNTTLFNFSIGIDGAIKETLKTVADTKTQTQYQYATTIAKRVKNTEIVVDKQGQSISELVEDMYEEDGIVNKNFTRVDQNIQNIINSVQNSGGNNLIKNSVMFAYDSDNNPKDWTVEGNGTLTIDSNVESLSAGGLSGHSFTLLDKIASQQVQVSTDNYYTFSTKIKKATTGSCYVKVYNSNEEYIIEIPVGENVFYKEYEIKELKPKNNYYIVEFYGSADSNATFTDNMLVVGSYKSPWQQANGEVMNTQVNINLEGVLVKSSVYLGDYTVMSPLEFAGYSKINGTITKVFSLNKDTTLVKKLEAEDEVKMVPIKIVPITSGDLQGWAFVPST